jgi:hypothetical protein
VLFGGMVVIAGGLLAMADAPPWLWGGLLGVGFAIAGIGFFRRR